MNIFELEAPDLKRVAKVIKEENRLYSWEMKKLPEKDIARFQTVSSKPFLEAWRSREFLCQIYQDQEGIERLSICRTIVDTTNRRWRDGITWDELQRVKREVGRGAYDAVEVYPSDEHIVDVANLRHLFVFRSVDSPSFIWRKPQ